MGITSNTEEFLEDIAKTINKINQGKKELESLDENSLKNDKVDKNEINALITALADPRYKDAAMKELREKYKMNDEQIVNAVEERINEIVGDMFS